MCKEENNPINIALKDVAHKMILAATTAPKGRGMSNITTSIEYPGNIALIAAKMKEIGKREGQEFFIRDADCILKAPVLLLFGVKINPLGLKLCGMCGFSNCDAKRQFPDVPCVFNTLDLGIAIGSAVSVAMDHRADNRIMYTVGQAVMELSLNKEKEKIVLGIPLSASPKNPFFDR